MKTSKEYKDLSIKEFNKAAEKYETDQAGIYKMCRKDYPKILEEIEKEDFETLLDIGCGTAPMLSLLTEKYPNKKYTGVDLSPNMIEKAKSKKIKNTTFLIGDAEALPLEDNKYDIIINSQSFHHYPNPEDFFHEVERVLKANGKLILRDNTTFKGLLWLMNHIELPLANLIGHGDVKAYSLKEVTQFCKNANLKVEKLEHQFPHRLHLVARKEGGK